MTLTPLTRAHRGSPYIPWSHFNFWSLLVPSHLKCLQENQKTNLLTLQELLLICRHFNFLLKLYTSTCQATDEICLCYLGPSSFQGHSGFENMQKFALRDCLKNWRANYDLLLNQAHLPRLSSRRKFLKLCLLFNIFTGKVAYHDSPLVRRSSPYPNRLQNSLYNSPLYTCQNWQIFFFFSSSSVEAWNSLHFDVPSKNSLLSCLI